ncbi:MAG: DNA mismatch repair protein MutS [Oscillospiraceae bacterium]|nr:DNA mismatch repair protein MutS [Oscillospiraceae bacterium]
MAELTPMMKQYLEIKEQNPDSILFFRLGDFYEMFNEDAKLASRELDLTLTTRDRNKSEEDRTPMCGVPFHSCESYIARLVAKGYKVAICEQTEDPALAKGLVKREITRVITPGTVTESSMLDEGKNNYIASVVSSGGDWAVAFCDVSTGAFYATDGRGNGGMEKIFNELGRFSPAEALLSTEAAGSGELRSLLEDRLGCCIQKGDRHLYDRIQDADLVLTQFGGETLQELGLGDCPAALMACGSLVMHLREIEKSDLCHIHHLEYYVSGQFMELDLTARRNLELTETMRTKEKRGSLLWVLDKTKTAMGGRLLRGWLEKPLLRPQEILRRSGAVEELVNKSVERQELQYVLRSVTDMERSIGRIVAGTANARDLLSMASAMQALPQVMEQLEGLQSPRLAALRDQLDPLTDLCEELSRAIVDDPPFTVREGGMIREGYDPQLDELRDIMSGGKGTLSAIENAEREKTGIPKLKVGYNRVFGYYIEISKTYQGEVPEGYIRKQTLANCERYITQELKELESTILGAKDRSTALEYDIFTRLRSYVAENAARIQVTSAVVAEVDVLCSLAEVAVTNGYVRPEVDLSEELRIKDGRHPVVERMLKDSLFVPNDTELGTGETRVAVITGPNMAGKSTYMRQVALIVLMAQIGSFVPASSARIGVCDRVFTRIGASDDLSSGQSTFMVEMSEVAEILRHGTSRSLLILDEIGRGTSTFDGMAIARAVLEYCASPKKLGAKVLFATHYHELTVMEKEIPGLRNYNIAVKKRGEDIIFLRKIVPGGAEASFGIEVARLAGVPEGVVNRARTILRELESGNAVTVPGKTAPAPEPTEQVSLMDMGGALLVEKLKGITIETLTPIEALNILFELKRQAESV